MTQGQLVKSELRVTVEISLGRGHFSHLHLLDHRPSYYCVSLTWITLFCNVYFYYYWCSLNFPFSDCASVFQYFLNIYCKFEALLRNMSLFTKQRT